MELRGGETSCDWFSLSWKSWQISTAESSQAGGTERMVQGHFRSVWPQGCGCKKGPGLEGKHSIGHLRNGRQAMLDHMRAGAEDRAGRIASARCTQDARAPPMPPLLPAHHHTRVSPAPSGWFCTLGVQPSGCPSPPTPTPSSHTMSNLCM